MRQHIYTHVHPALLYTSDASQQHPSYLARTARYTQLKLGSHPQASRHTQPTLTQAPLPLCHHSLTARHAPWQLTTRPVRSYLPSTIYPEPSCSWEVLALAFELWTNNGYTSRPARVRSPVGSRILCHPAASPWTTSAHLLKTLTTSSRGFKADMLKSNHAQADGSRISNFRDSWMPKPPWTLEN